MVAAGEVEQYGFCAHNWHLARAGVDPEGTSAERGIQAQRRLASAVQDAARAQAAGQRELRWAYLVLGLCVLLTVASTLAVMYRPGPRLLAAVAGTLALLNAAAGLLTLSLYAQRLASRLRRDVGLLVDGVEAKAAIIRDAEWGLSGHVHYVLHVGQRVVPMLFKTGRTPRKPYRSHSLHLLALLRLVEVRDGRAPEYGLLSYPGGVFRVDYDEAGRQQLRDALGLIRQAQATGVADRDHEEPRRCLGCARRPACTQALA